jgi:hypothetical protein
MSRQLSLFKGRRQLGVEPPAPLEFETQCWLVDIARRWMMPGWRVAHWPAGEQREHIIRDGRRISPSGSRLSRAGAVPGYPDLVFTGPNRGIAWLELKRKGRGRTPAQIDVGNHLQACGFPYLVTDNVRVAADWLKQLGILQSKVSVQ